MGRKILFVTTDQQRYDTLGCNGGTLARTPVVDGLAADGHPLRAGPSRSRSCACRRASTMLTGQHPSTHGVWMNGVPLPVDAPSVADVLHDAGYRTALDRQGRTSSRSSTRSAASPRTRFGRDRHRAAGRHAPRLRAPRVRHPRRRRAAALRRAGWRPSTPRRSAMFYPVLDGDLQVNARGRRRHRRAAGARQPDPARVVPHRLGRRPHDRLARLARRRRRLVLLDELPRPAPPVGPAAVGDRPHRLARRAAARRLPRRSRPSARRILDAKPRHWRLWYDGTLVSNYEAPARLGAGDAHRRPGARGQRPQRGRVRADRRGARAGARGDRRHAAGPTTSTSIFTTDHGELQGDFGLLFKGPYHVDALMRLPLVWRPAPSAGVAPRRSSRRPVGLVDLAPTFCAIAGVGRAGVDAGRGAAGRRRRRRRRGFERVLTEWDSELFGVDVHLRTITRDGWVCTAYRPGLRCTTAPRASCTTSPTTRCSSHNRWDDPSSALAAGRPPRRPVGQPAARRTQPRLELQAPGMTWRYEDGGPRRSRRSPAGSTLAAGRHARGRRRGSRRPRRWSCSTSRASCSSCATPRATERVSFVEQIDPHTLEPLAQSRRARRRAGLARRDRRRTTTDRSTSCSATTPTGSIRDLHGARVAHAARASARTTASSRCPTATS